MASKGQSLTVQYVAWDTSANAGKTGDVGNHTLRWVKDGTSAAPDNSPSEVDATNAPGIYKLTLTADECNCWVGTLCGKSSTSNVSIMPLTVTFEQLPTAAPAASGGLITRGTGTGQLQVYSGAVRLDLTQSVGLFSSPALGWYISNTSAIYTNTTGAAQRAAVGLASANLDAQIGGLDLLLDAIKAKTDKIPASPAAVGSEMSLAEDAITAATFADNAIAAVVIAAEAANKLADHIRRRKQASVEASNDGDELSLSSQYGAIQQMQNANTTAAADKLTVKKTDDTALGTLATTDSSGADPMTGISNPQDA